jgi:phosphoadenosine phosphosulfate reductase
MTYPETQAMVDYAKTLLPVHTVFSDRMGQNATFGLPSDLVPINWTALGQQVTVRKPIMVQSYLQCCWENIAAPCAKKAKALGCTHLVSGQRAEEPRRASSQHGERVDGLVRLYPIQDWTTKTVLAYLATKMTVPVHYAIRHSSLDCYDCTAYSEDSQDRIDWTHRQYPQFHAAYQARREALDGVLLEALSYAIR